MPEIPAPQPWTACGATYPVMRLTPVAIEELQNLVRARVPNPRVEAAKAIQGLDPEVAKYIYDDMVKSAGPWPPPFGDPRATAVLMTAEARTLVIYHACRKHNNGFDREKAAALADQVDQREFQELMALIQPAEGDAAPKVRRAAGAA